MIKMSEGGVIAATGCKPNCHRDKYNVEQMYYETLTDIPGYEWLDGKRVAKVSFAYAGASYEEDTEYFAYDEKVDKLPKITDDNMDFTYTSLSLNLHLS